MATLSTLIQKHNLRAEVLGSATAPSGWDYPTLDYSIKLRMHRRQMTLNFYTGIGWDREPDASDVMDCLISDATSVENARGFEDWAEEVGYDTDSRQAERTYRAVVNQVERLRRFLGEYFDEFVWSERD